MCQMPVNKIDEVIRSRGFKELKPTDEQLKKMDTSLKMWNKWILKKRDPELYQLPAIADFLGCSISELVGSKPVLVSAN